CIVVPDVELEILTKELAPLAFQIFDKLVEEISFLFDYKEFKSHIIQLRLEIQENGELFSNYIQVLSDVFGYAPLDVLDMSLDDVLRQMVMAEQIVKKDLFFAPKKRKGFATPITSQVLDEKQQRALYEAERALEMALMKEEVKKFKENKSKK
ncbi:MAG: hypothetical protein ACTSWR_08220, partial [Candidatus Helarchaeota archaeon]